MRRLLAMCLAILVIFSSVGAFYISKNGTCSDSYWYHGYTRDEFVKRLRTQKAKVYMAGKNKIQLKGKFGVGRNYNAAFDAAFYGDVQRINLKFKTRGDFKIRHYSGDSYSVSDLRWCSKGNQLDLGENYAYAVWIINGKVKRVDCLNYD